MPRTARIEEPIGKSSPLPDISQQVNSNGPDQWEVLFAIGQLNSANDRLKEAQTLRKRCRSALKLRGHSLDALDWGIKEKGLDDGTTLAKWKERQRVAQFMGLPIGAQVTFFETPQGNGLSQQSVNDKAFNDGKERGVMGLNPDDQAYPPLTPEGSEHRRGWNEGQDILKVRFTKMNADMAAAEAAKAAKNAKKNGADDDEDEPDDAGDEALN
jgi:hypothetical protein